MAHIDKVVAVNTTENPTEAQDKISSGVDLIANIVKITLGPHGRNVVLEKGLKVTNDGISIAKEVQSEDEVEDLALRIVREASVKTNEQAGDGTTTALTMAQAGYKEFIRLLPGKSIAGKTTVMKLRKDVKESVAFVVDELKKMAKPVESVEELVDVARVSSEDDVLAELIGKTQFELGKDGILIVEPTNDTEDSIERVKGIRFDNGFGTSLVTNNKEKQRLEVDGDVKVIMMNYTLESLGPILTVLEALGAKQHMDVVIVARAFTNNAIQACMKNHENGFNIFPINAPYLNQGEVMRDLEAVLGGTYFDQDEKALESMSIEDVGTAKKVIAERFTAIFTGNNDEATQERIKERIDVLKQTHKGEDSTFMEKNIEGRMAQLTNGFALVKVGSVSEADRKYKVDKAEDAVSATKSALQEGTVPGAGMAYKMISEKMENGNVLKLPLLAPYDQIMKNAGELFEVEDWVRNSVKVERVALENAIHVAVNLATAGGAVAKKIDKPMCHGQG